MKRKISFKTRLECFFKGHNIIVEYPWIKTWYKNGTGFYSVTTLRYCNRCKRAFK